jgi:hypothetical protein
MRGPCSCGTHRGFIKPAGGQDCVYCYVCGKWQYNAPRVETGRAVRTVQTVLNGISAAQKARIKMRASGRCEICGAKPADAVGLQVSHIIGRNVGIKEGMSDGEINSDENLFAGCPECNQGLKEEIIPLRLAISIVRLRLKNRGVMP